MDHEGGILGDRRFIGWQVVKPRKVAIGEG